LAHLLDRGDDSGTLLGSPVIEFRGGQPLGALALGRRDRRLGIGQQGRLIVLYRQDIVATAVCDRLGHGAMAVQGIGRHHAALELDQFDQLQGSGGFVVVGRQRVGQRHAGLRRPQRDHDRWHMSLAALVAAPQRLAVDRHHTLRTLDPGRLGKRRHEPLERPLEGLRIEHAEHPAESVVAGQPVWQRQYRFQQVRLGARKQRHVRATCRSAQRRKQSNEQQVRQIVQRVRCPRVRQFRKTGREALHRWLLWQQEPSSESISLARTTTYSSEHAIPLPVMRGRLGGGKPRGRSMKFQI
jgi:hypothetical protein